MSNQMRKGFSLGGAAPLRTFDVPPNGPVYPPNPQTLAINDYRQPTVREQVLAGPAPVTWVKLWIDFNYLLRNFTYNPNSTQYTGVWAYLDTVENSAIQRLDRQIAAANADNKYVVICLYQSLPVWCTVAPNGVAPPSGKTRNEAYPDGQPGRPWSWLIAYLFARYKNGAPSSPGPGAGGTQRGNPYAAWAYMIEFTNEPNILLWPQGIDSDGNGNGYACAIATMMKTAEECAVFWAQGSAPYVLGPAVLDDDPVSSDSRVHWERFTRNVLGALNGWQPRVYVGWSLHNYGDVKYQQDGFRAKRCVELFSEYNWKNGTDTSIFITESGLNMGSSQGVLYNPAALDASATGESRQTSFNQQTYTSMYLVPQAYCWLNHNVNDDAGVSFISGVNQAWVPSAGAPRGVRPFRATWRQLGSSFTP